MADDNKQSRQFKQPQDDEKENPEEKSDGRKDHLVKRHYEQKHPHEDIPEVLATSTIAEGFYVVTLQGPHGPYHAILIRDKNGSTLIGKQ